MHLNQSRSTHYMTRIYSYIYSSIDLTITRPIILQEIFHNIPSQHSIYSILMSYITTFLVHIVTVFLMNGTVNIVCLWFVPIFF